MAKPTENTNAGSELQIENEAPAGQYIATCVRIIDQFGVTRKKFQSQEDVTRFIFGVYGPHKALYLIQTFEFTISTAPTANLMAFLKAWLGKTPEMGWDYHELIGKGAAITVEWKTSTRNPIKSYALISGIGPIFPQWAAFVAPRSMYEPLLLAVSQSKPTERTPPA